VNTLRGLRRLEGERGARSKVGSWTLAAALHVVLGAALLKLLAIPLPLSSLFDDEKPVVERISFIAVPRNDGTPPQAGQRGGDDRPVREPSAPAPKIEAPREVPTGVAPSAPARAVPEDGLGPLYGGGGPTRGIRPSYSDPRVWVPPGEVLAAPKSQIEKMDSSVVAAIKKYQDSVAVATGGRAPDDWTFTKGGQKYGLDGKGLHLGALTIPKYLLPSFDPRVAAAMNPAAAERAKLDAISADIRLQAQRAMTEDEFRKAVKALRERKDRERERAKQAPPTPIAERP
jgi:hypothetical protein